MNLQKLGVLDHGYVELLDVFGDDLTPVRTARVSFAQDSIELEEKDRKLIRYLLEHEHTSPFRHASVSLRIKCPLFVKAQFDKHQVGVNINSQSGRYTVMDEEFYVPEVFRKQSKDNKQGSEGALAEGLEAFEAHEFYWDAIQRASVAYKELLDMGVAKELARCVLPQALYTTFIMTMSLQAAMHFVHLRVDGHAQWEMQEYGKAVLAILREQFPVVVSEYERAERKVNAEAALSLVARKMALADVLFEFDADKGELALNAVRGELREIVGEYADLYDGEA